jgi:ATP-dependent DNA helicase RecQ
MPAQAKHKIVNLIDYLVKEGYLSVSDGQYPVITLNGRSAEIADAPPHSITIKMPKYKAETPRAAKPVKAQAAYSGQLFQRLRELRTELAKEAGVPAYIVFADAALADMCRKLPCSKEEFLNVSGVGQQKLEKYGDVFIKIICDYTEQQRDGDAV